MYVTSDVAYVGQDRHLSVRLTGELAVGLEAMAAERGLTHSHLVRELLAVDVAEKRRRLTG